MPSTDTALVPVADRALAGLDDRFSGAVLRPGDTHYEAARQLWNAAFDRRPAAIAQARTEADVAAAVLAARDAGLEIAIRSGGHSIPGHSMVDGGVTIDLSAMNSVSVDPDSGRARVGAGALLMDVAEAGAPHRRILPFGHISHTGIGGFTLGGGIGWVMRKLGLAVDSLRSVRMVTAEGELVEASADLEPELFWALRGGGGNFGVVTEFEFDLHPVGEQILAGMVLHPLEDAAEALRFSRDFMDQAPDEACVYEVFITAPPTEPFPAHLQGKPVLALGMSYCGAPEEGERVLRPLREFGRPALDVVAPMPPTALQTMLDPTAPHGMNNYNRSHWLAGLPDDAIERLVELHAEVPSPLSQIINARMGGAIERVDAEATAFVHRDANRLLWVVSSWYEGDAAEQQEWCRRVFDAMTPHSTGGVYVNALGEESVDRVRASYADETWRRLVDAKRRWDPDNVFRLNQNIPPSG